MQTGASRFSTVIPVIVGAALLVPVLLVTTLVLMMTSNLGGKQSQNPAAQTSPQAFAKSFYIILRQPGENIHIWGRNLDGQPDFRQTVETNGQPVSHQLYLSTEKALYESQQNPGQALKWNKTPNLEPGSVGVASITGGPAVWALQYGVGDQVVPLQQGSLNITVKSVNEPIADTIFQPTKNPVL